MARNYGEGTIRSRGNESWELKWYVKDEGKYHYKTFHGTEPQARKVLRKIVAEVDSGTYSAPSKLTVGDVLVQYLERSKSKSDKTYHTYEQIMRLYLQPKLGKIEIAKLQILELDKYFAGLNTSGRYRGSGGLSSTSIAHCRRILNQAFTWANRKQLIKVNPVKLTDPIKGNRKEMKILAEPQLGKLINNCADNIWGMPILLSALTGARQGECLGLTWDCVDFVGRTIYICKTLQCIGGETKLKPEPKNSSSIRLIPIRDTLINALKRQREIQQLRKLEWGEAYEDNNLVCTREDGSAMVGPNLTNGLKLLLKTLELPIIRFHDLRHTHASILLKSQPIQVVSKRLGHKNPKITLDTYCHLLPGMGDTAADAFEEIIS